MPGNTVCNINYVYSEGTEKLDTFAAKHLKNQYLSAKHVSRTPEYLGYMGSTLSISRTIQTVTVKLSKSVANIYNFYLY